MNTLSLSRWALTICVAAALLADCSSGLSSGVPSGLGLGVLNPAGSAHFHPHRLWAARDIAKSPRLLFISAGTGTVNIYSMPDLTLKGQVAGFGNEIMAGECADRSGNIWVTSQDHYYGPDQDGTLTKLAHDGKVLRSMEFPSGFPDSCAVDPTTGNLAVTERFSGTSAGALVIYVGGSGPGKKITNPQQSSYFWDGYDTSGHLWVDGWGNNGRFILSQCSASNCSTIPISGGKIYDAGFVQYAVLQKTWYVADEYCGYKFSVCIYPVSRSGVLGTAIPLTNSRGQKQCLINQGVITNAKSPVLAGGMLSNGTCSSHSVDLWNFPAGGRPTQSTAIAKMPVGAAISDK